MTLRGTDPEWYITEYTHPGGNPGVNVESISHRCHPIPVVFVWELTKETMHMPLDFLQGGVVYEDYEQLAGCTSTTRFACLDERGSAGNGKRLRDVQRVITKLVKCTT